MTKTTEVAGGFNGTITLYQGNNFTIVFSPTSGVQSLMSGGSQGASGDIQSHSFGLRLGVNGEYDLNSNAVTITGTAGDFIFASGKMTIDGNNILTLPNLSLDDVGVGGGFGKFINNGVTASGGYIESHLSLKDGFVVTSQVGIGPGAITIRYDVDDALWDAMSGTETETLRRDQQAREGEESRVHGFLQMVFANEGAYDTEAEVRDAVDYLAQLRGQSDATQGGIFPGQTQTILTPSGMQTTNVMQTVRTPSGAQQVWVGSSYLGGGTSNTNSAATGTTSGNTSGGHHSGGHHSGSHHNDPDNNSLTDNSNSNNNDDDDDDDNAAAGSVAGGLGGVTTPTSNTGAAGGPVPGSSSQTTTYVNTGNNPGNNNAPGYNPTVTHVTTTTTQVIGPQPILLDLDGNGIQLTDLTRSTVFMEGEEGLKHRTAWAGAGDGVLFYDTDGDDKISDMREYVFTEWDPTAKDDLAALRSRFDSNGDGRLSGAELNGFKVMDTGANGSLTALSVASLGITQIGLREHAKHFGCTERDTLEFSKTKGVFLLGGLESQFKRSISILDTNLTPARSNGRKQNAIISQ